MALRAPQEVLVLVVGAIMEKTIFECHGQHSDKVSGEDEELEAFLEMRAKDVN